MKMKKTTLRYIIAKLLKTRVKKKSLKETSKEPH